MNGPDGRDIVNVFINLDSLRSEEPDHPVSQAWARVVALNAAGRCPHCWEMIDEGVRQITEREIDERACDLFCQEFFLRDEPELRPGGGIDSGSVNR